MERLVRTATRKTDEKSIHFGDHKARVSRFVKESSGEPVGTMIKIQFGPHAITEVGYFTFDGQTFHQLSSQINLTDYTLDLVIKQIETDPVRVSTLEEALKTAVGTAKATDS